MLAGSVLITGCSRGLGLEMVRQLVNSKSPPDVVIATCRNPENAVELQELARDHRKLKIIKFDVVDFKSLPKLREEVREAVGERGLNLLINNAGIMEKSNASAGIPLEQLEPHEFYSVMETNTTAPLMMVKAMLPLLRVAAGAGGSMGVSRAAVINISSDLSSMGAFVKLPDSYCYRASKAALNMVTKTLSVEYGVEGMIFVAIHPGWVKTDMGSMAADLTPEQSISNVLRLLFSLGEKHNGQLLSYQGTVIAW